MKALVAGASGQLGLALVAQLGDRVAWSGGRTALDVRDPAAVAHLVREVRPDVVFNASAYNNVDGAETQIAEAMAVNAAGPGNLARAARDVGALIVHVSTDYVFDGAQSQPYGEQDCPHPLGVYGTSKLAGEHLVRNSGAEHLVVRTSGLFGAGGSRIKGGSFVERILARARSGQALKVVSDQAFSPTYAPDLAAALLLLVEKHARGLVHVTNSGSCTWHGLAVEALRCAGLDTPVEEIHARDLLSPAHRPPHSILSKERYESFGLKALRPWSDAVKEFLS